MDIKTVEELNQKLAEIPNIELIAKVKSGLRELCRTGGKSFVMHVPVQINDFDMILSELIIRFEKCEQTKSY